MGVLGGSMPAAQEARTPSTAVIDVVDIHRAPEAPEAHVPAPPVAQAVAKKAPPVEPRASGIAIGSDAGPADAGVGDAGLAVGDAGPRDAGADDGGLIALPSVTGDTPLAGSLLGAAPAEGSSESPAAPPGAAADLRPYAPEGDVITVILRLDRLRGTEWAAHTREILGPMPDYQAIIGGRDIALADSFETLVITSHAPREVAATTIAARTRLDAEAVRNLVGPRAQWSAVTGGAMGKGPYERVFLMPYPHWIVFAAPEELGGLLAPRAGPLSQAAPDALLPEWLSRVREIEAESGTGEEGPAVVVSAQGFPDVVEVPRVGQLPGPAHAALALTVDPLGFYVRGTLTFDSEVEAAEMVRAANAAKERLVGSLTGALVLRGAHAYHAVNNLSLIQRGNQVAYATSISTADGRAMMDLVAAWSEQFYGARTAHH